MIKKLQIKFIVTNMIIVTVMICIIFVLIYGNTQKSLETESISMMRSIGKNPAQMARVDEGIKNLRLPYFRLDVDKAGKLVSAMGGYYDLSDIDKLQSLAKETLKCGGEIGIFKEKNLRYLIMHNHFGYTLIYSDITSQIRALNNLLKSFVVVGVFAFGLFFGISILLSRWAVKPIEKAWQQQKQFVSDASHELKTPLTVIITNAELLNEENGSNLSKGILLMSYQMKSLVDKMLCLAQTEEKQKQEMEMLSLSELLQDAIINFEGIFMDKGLILEEDIKPEVYIKGDETELRQLIDILLDNSQKYSKPQGITKISLKTCSKRAVFCVSNEGEAIGDEELDEIFERFYRVDTARQRDGSFGLGLAIAQNIVKNHKGRLWAESKNGYNSFYVEFSFY